MSGRNNVDSPGSRVRTLRESLNLSQQAIGDLAGETQTAVSSWERGRYEPSLEALKTICHKLDVNPSWLFLGDGPMLIGKSSHDTVAYGAESSSPEAFQLSRGVEALRNAGNTLATPVALDVSEIPPETFVLVNRFQASAEGGSGIDNADADRIEPLAFRREWLRRKGLFPHRCSVIGIVGASMEPTLKAGDIVLVDERDPDIRRAGIYVFTQAGDLRVKRLKQESDGSLTVRSDNPAYGEEHYAASELPDVRVIGKVVWAARELA